MLGLMRRGLLRGTVALLGLALTACPGVKSKLCGGANQPCCSSKPVCDVGNTCDATQTCVACGAVGQTCCDGQSCGTGALCSTGNACVACGGDAQPCCANDSCQAGLSCGGGTCSAGCGTPCTLGESRCSSTGGIDSCSTGAACPQWKSLLSTCPGGTSCMASAGQASCVELCPVTCTPDALQCTVEGLKRCVLASGASCPTLNTEPDDPAAPQCVTGAQDGATLVWESPAPLHTPLVGIAGDLPDSYWVLDNLGNVIHNDLGQWVYEVRATPGKRMKAIASCGLGSYLFAVGEGGTAMRRSGGTWTEENVGSTTDLDAVACDSALNAYAAGADGKLYIRNGSWSSYATGFTGNVTGLGYLFSDQKLALVGAGGQIVGCNFAALPPTCAAQTSGTTQNLNAAFGEVYSSHIFAAGDHGTLLEGVNGTWTALDTGSAANLRGVGAYYDNGNSRPVPFAVGDNGAFFSRPLLTLEPYTAAPMETLTAVMPQDSTHVFVTSLAGAIWFTDQPSPPPTVTMTSRGGTKPISQTLTAVASIGMGRLFAVGQAGARYRRENSTWLDDRAGLAVSEDLTAVAAISSGEAYAAGANGRLLVRRFGTWSDDAPGLTTTNLEGLAYDSTTVYAVGAGGAWFEKSRSGGTWAQVAQTATTENLWGVVVILDTLGHTQEVVAVGSNCTVLSKKNGGFSVVPIAQCPTGSPLYAAAVPSSGELYVGGDPLLVLHRTSSGWTREYLSATSLEQITALVPQGSNLWALTTRGEAYFRVTGWTQFEPDLTSSDLLGGVFDADQGLFIVGARGLVWRTP